MTRRDPRGGRGMGWTGVAFLLTLAMIILGHAPIRTEAYKPVVLVHGILDKRDSLTSLADRIREMHPGTNVTMLDRLHGFRSLIPLWAQVHKFRQDLDPIMAANPGGINLLGFSQGGLISRGLIQSIPNHNVHTFISLSSPQAGQYGDDFLHIFFPNLVKTKAWKLFYSRLGQDVSIGNYWRDPHHIPLFLNHSNFLAQIDNCVGNPNSTEFKDNFIKIRRLVLIGGPDDGIISPWESAQFGFYNKNESVVDMRGRLEYKWDLFGLKTLDKEDKVIRHTVPGVQHLQWHRNKTVIDKYILPYLD